jgi:heterodisulfide reductase subunit C
VIDMAVFQQFQDAITHLGERAQPAAMSDAERVARAKDVMRRKTDRALAMDLESCVNCGYCSEACHFYQGTQDAQYTPTRKLDLLRRVHARETSAFVPLKRLFTADITADDLRAWQPLVYDACTECGRCSMVCPMGINIARGVNVMREALYEAGLAPLELTAVAQEQAGRGTVFGVGPEQLMQVVQALRGQGIEVPMDEPHTDVMLVTTVIVPGRAGRHRAHPQPPGSALDLAQPRLRGRELRSALGQRGAATGGEPTPDRRGAGHRRQDRDPARVRPRLSRAALGRAVA